jgi:hypothetical protein
LIDRTVNDIQVTKFSGAVETLNLDKLKSSLTRSGADKLQADEIIDKILKVLEPTTSTRKIYRLARKYLRQLNRVSGIRYTLKTALQKLGPSGYPFEKYFGAILENYGYEIKVGIMLEGRCVQHEVDVLAVNDKEVSLYECKYRNSPGNTTDVKVAMYVDSRFRDLKPVIIKEYPGRTFRGGLVTNTRFTSDAVKYAECSGLQITSWRHPQKDSLESLIEEKKLYPITIISGINSDLVRSLIAHDIILLKDLAGMDVKKMMRMLSLPERKASSLKKQADELCLC